MAVGVVVGAVWQNGFVVVGLTAYGTMVKGWNDFKKFSFKVDMSIRVHDLRKDLDRTENVCQRTTPGRI